ncbi:MAG: sarcosine oxidase subunit beta family protein [Micropepsaceae bacterium]
MKEYSAWQLLRHGLGGHRSWKPAWRCAHPKSKYDVVIVGGGGHGLAAAYYLARLHGVTSVAVLEKGWIGGGNTGRNTTIIRSNYYYPESIALFELGLKLYEGLSDDLNFNIMFSQRGLFVTAHSRHQMENIRRWVGAMQAYGVDAELIDVPEIEHRVPSFNTRHERHPVWGGFKQERAGTARHDAVAWGYARGADRLGVDIIQNCEVTGFRKNSNGTVTGVETNEGIIGADKVLFCTAGHSSVLAQLAGFRLPVSSYALQAFVTEPLKPVLDVVSWSLVCGVYVSQSDKGGLVFGGALDLYNSYAQRGNIPVAMQVVGDLGEYWPAFRNARVVRQWAGIVDVVQDSSPILGETPVPGLYINCGWGTGGFKAIPAGGWLMAHHLATGKPHDIAKPFGLKRFETGALIDEAAGAGIEH